jgi:hypothetical protein
MWPPSVKAGIKKIREYNRKKQAIKEVIQMI